MNGRHGLMKEGIVTGVIGATVIAVWFFIVDMVTGRPFFTPDVLGTMLLRIFGAPSTLDTVFLHVALYTVFHYLVFAILGMLIVAIVHQGQRTPGILAGFLILFVAMQLGALGFTALFAESPLGQVAWYQIFIANLLAAAAMGWWVRRRHPGVGGELRAALEGTDEYPGRYDTSKPEKARDLSAG